MDIVETKNCIIGNPIKFPKTYNLRGSHSLLYVLYTCAQYLFVGGGGYLPCIKEYKVWYFQNKGKCLYFDAPYQ